MFKSKKYLKYLSAGLAVMWLLAAGAQESGGRTLQALDYTALEGDRVLLTLTLSEAAPEPVIFTIDKPARLSLDLPDTHLAIADRFRKIGIGKVRSVAAVEAKGRTRVVVELSDPSAYNVRVEGNKILVQLDNTASAAATVNIGTVAPVVNSLLPKGPSVTNVDFRRGEKGEGRVVVTLADPKTAVDVSEIGGKVVARFKNVSLADTQLRRLDVLDFATPVKFVDVQRVGNDAEITVTAVDASDFEQVAYQSGNVFTLELQPLTEDKAAERKKLHPQFTGERVSLSFQSVDIRSLLQIIADVAGTNMVVSDQVNGEIAMRLQNVPWDQALDIILRTKGLGMRQQGNVMLVAPLEELATRDKIELEAAKTNTDLAPLRSELIQVNYAKATDIAALLKSAASGNTRNSILSDRGQVTVDSRTNQLIVLETREKLGEIRTLVSQLDVPVKQVLIESRIVIAHDDYRKELGARFGLSAVGTANGGNNLLATTGTATGTNTIVSSALASNGTNITLPSTTDRFNVNLPSAGSTGSIALAILGANYLVDLELSALQTEGRGEVISNPRVITANGKLASIEQGTEIPYLESASSGAATVAFRKAVLSLNVTPQITPDNRILMDLTVTDDTLGANVNVGVGSAPAIDTRRINTTVQVKSGETVVLGGVFDANNEHSASKVPFLGDIPLVGVFFKNNDNNTTKRELLIFVTPKILQEGLKVR